MSLTISDFVCGRGRAPIAISAGDVLVPFTEGISEAMNKADDMTLVILRAVA